MPLVVALDRVGEHVEGPSVEAAVDDAKRRLQGTHELVGAARMVEIVLLAAVRDRERRLVRA